MNLLSYGPIKATIGTAYPMAVAGATVFGASLHDWVYITAIIAAVCQSFFLILKIVSWFRNKGKDTH